ncbi:MAG TPA: hypothetical protein VMF61_01240 [Candidatus Acidoferrales bacterium]|nr:hypothetical protein [Candidatus Acidoferrales bacterium]
MRWPYGLAIFVSALLIAGCAESASVPNTVPANAAFAVPNSPAGDCAVAKYPTFHGACTRVTLRESGTTLALVPYRGFQVTYALPHSNATHADWLSIADATGHGDITGTVNGKRFPKYPSPCYASGGCPGKAFLYFLMDMHAKNGVQFNGQFTFTVTAARKRFSTYATCYYAGSYGGGPDDRLGWSPEVSATPNPNGKSLPFTFTGGYWGPGAQIIALACDEP